MYTAMAISFSISAGLLVLLLGLLAAKFLRREE
jgi:hypothetical protein